MSASDWLKVTLAFINAAAGLIAAYPGPELGAMERLVCAAMVAGCGAALLVTNPPGRSKRIDPALLTAAQTRQVVDELERRLKEAPRAHG